MESQAIYTSYKKELDYLDGQISRQKQLIVLQKSWLENRVADLQDPNKSVLAKIFTYDAENRILQYRGDDSPGSGFGLDILEHLNRRDINNQAIGDAATAAKQLAYLKKQGFNIADLVYNDDGTLVAKYKNGTLYNAEDGNRWMTGQTTLLASKNEEYDDSVAVDKINALDAPRLIQCRKLYGFWY